MKYTMMIGALLCATACVSPKAHQQLQRELEVVKAQHSDLTDEHRKLAGKMKGLVDENAKLRSNAVDAAYIEEQRQKLDDLLRNRGNSSARVPEFDNVEVVQTAEGLAFSIKGQVLFSPGQNTLSEVGKRTLSELFKSNSLTGKLRVQGHTDDQPIVRSRWGTNLRLSAERALSVADFLISAGVPAEDVSVAGYGEHRPKVAAQTDEARKANRRVEILLLDR